jgi:hypothetical protein
LKIIINKFYLGVWGLGVVVSDQFVQMARKLANNEAAKAMAEKLDKKGKKDNRLSESAIPADWYKEGDFSRCKASLNGRWDWSANERRQQVEESWGLGKLVGIHTTENYQNLKIREKSRDITKNCGKLKRGDWEIWPDF